MAEIKSRDSIAKVRADIPVILDQALSPIAAQLARIEAAMNRDYVAEPAPFVPPFGLDLATWEALPAEAQAAMLPSESAHPTTTTTRPVVRAGLIATVRTGTGQVQPIIYNTGGMRMSDALDRKIKEVNRLVNLQTGKPLDGAKVMMSKYFQKIWNRELAAKNRLLWDTPANVARAKAMTAAGNVTNADSWNSKTRKRLFYRKTDSEDGSNAGKWDGLVLEMYMPKLGDGWLRVVEFTNPVRK